MYSKLLCTTSVFVINYNYLSVKYDLCKRDWYCDVAHLLETENIRACLFVTLRLLLVLCMNCVIEEMAIQMVVF